MDKFLEFFTRSNILTEEEYLKLKDKCEFEISKNDDGSLKLIVNFYNLIEPKLYFDFS